MTSPPISVNWNKNFLPCENSFLFPFTASHSCSGWLWSSHRTLRWPERASRGPPLWLSLWGLLQSFCCLFSSGSVRWWAAASMWVTWQSKLWWVKVTNEAMEWTHRGRLNSASMADTSDERCRVETESHRWIIVIHIVVHTERHDEKHKVQHWKWGSANILKTQENQAETSGFYPCKQIRTKANLTF